jgi:hypothetical protein
MKDKSCIEECKSMYCFPCVSGLCPLGLDFLKDCYPKLKPEQRVLFDELFILRAEVAKGKEIKVLA